ncbi:MAG: serine/threonine protein kinase, partial [Deltaproteobacteria bacterium]|nr:serine/threonine protein kinase [Deltaproteobacteria bacterium]
MMQLPYRFGRYTLLQRLAAGGMGEIYRARYEGEGGFSKTVAIKRVLPSHAADTHLTSMFLDEARVLTYLQHQNIVQVFELGKCEEQFFISMEYVDGIDLRRLFLHLMRGELELPRRFLLHIIAQLLQGLDFVHRSSGPDGRPLHLIHRDLSPANILISWNGEVKITDFGIAKGFHRSEETTTVQLKGK